MLSPCYSQFKLTGQRGKMPRKRQREMEMKWARESCGESEITRASKDIVSVAPLTVRQLSLHLIQGSFFGDFCFL